MRNINSLIKECLSYEDEREWFEFKENFIIDQIG